MRVINLHYADDVVVLTSIPEYAQAEMNITSIQLTRLGLLMNMEKTEGMHTPSRVGRKRLFFL